MNFDMKMTTNESTLNVDYARMSLRTANALHIEMIHAFWSFISVSNVCAYVCMVITYTLIETRVSKVLQLTPGRI